MGRVTQQTFVEAVDGVETLFTAQAEFQWESIQVFQGNLPLAPGSYRNVSTLKVRILDAVTQQEWTLGAVAHTVYCTGHGLSNGAYIVVWSTSLTGLPIGLDQTIGYYVVNKTDDTFQLALTAGGESVSFVASSSGTLYFAAPYAPLAANGILW